MSTGRPRQLRSRLALLTVAVVVLLVAAGVIGGVIVNDRRQRRPRMEPHGHPAWLIVLALMIAVVFVIAIATWRLLTRPLADLLSAAERVGAGEAAPTVPAPATGSREVRELVTTFNAMTARLARTDEERRRFLADVTHELRTPLTVLRSGIEAQLDGVHARDDEHLTALLDETAILARVIDDLHTLALSEAGRLSLHLTPVEIGTLVADAVASFAPAAEQRRITLRATGPLPPDPSPVVDVDPGRIRQVLGNLLANAIRHAPEEGHVDVLLEPTAGLVRVQVLDDGPGFSAEDLPHVFTRYRKAIDSGGSGLGLTIARDLVQLHGGTIEAANRADGTGAVITFTLPAA